MIISVLFHKKVFSKEKALKWLKKYGLKTDKFSETENYMHFTQKKASKKIKLRTIKARSGVQFVIAIKKKLIQAGFAFNALPANIQSLMDKYGNKLITSAKVCRKPIPQTLEKIADLFTLGKFNAIKKKLGYDYYYHLYVDLVLDDNTPITLEKNQVINISEGHKSNPSACMEIPKLKNSKITLSEYFNTAVQKYGADFIFDYEMLHKNCQRFVEALNTANGVSNPELRKFVNQNIKDAVQSDFLRTGARVATKIGEAFSMVLGKAKDMANKLFNIF